MRLLCHNQAIYIIAEYGAISKCSIEGRGSNFSNVQLTQLQYILLSIYCVAVNLGWSKIIWGGGLDASTGILP